MRGGATGPAIPPTRGERPPRRRRSWAHRAAAAPDREAAEGQAGTGAPDLRVDQRAIIYTGTMRVQVDDVEAAARRAVDAVPPPPADSSAGTSAAASTRPPRRTGAAGAGGEVHPASSTSWPPRAAAAPEIRTQDVTEETVDLDARITTQRARVDSARRLLARANTCRSWSRWRTR